MKLDGQYDQQYFRASKKFQLEPERIKRQVNFIQALKPIDVLDVGCGLGALVKELNRRGIRAMGIDNAMVLPELYWDLAEPFALLDAKQLPYMDKIWDVVFSSDFFEHVPEDEIDAVANEMRRVGKRIYASIAFEKKLNARQKLYHLTNKPKEWWQAKLPNITIINEAGT